MQNILFLNKDIDDADNDDNEMLQINILLQFNNDPLPSKIVFRVKRDLRINLKVMMMATTTMTTKMMLTL